MHARPPLRQLGQEDAVSDGLWGPLRCAALSHGRALQITVAAARIREFIPTGEPRLRNRPRQETRRAGGLSLQETNETCEGREIRDKKVFTDSFEGRFSFNNYRTRHTPLTGTNGNKLNATG